MKKGFTLVELSIVLVIIGLLIGGILVAQSMIGTAKVQAQVRQFGQFDAAVNNFKTKFKYLPGDNPLMNGLVNSPTTFGDGDNNGLIESFDGVSSCRSWNYSGETGNFWHDLSISGLLSQSGTAYAGTPTDGSPTPLIISGAGVNIPVAKAGKNGVVVPICLTDWTNNRGNFYAIISLAADSGDGSFSATNSPATSANTAITPVDALALDSKMDDGNGQSGNVGNGQVAAPVFHTGFSRTEISSCSSSGVYQTATASEQCVMLFRMGTTTGGFQ